MKFNSCYHTNEGSNNNSYIGGSAFVGNGFCDDGLNKVECNFDGGDCCGYDHNTGTVSIQCLAYSCSYKSWLGDGFCDDETNIEGE